MLLPRNIMWSSHDFLPTEVKYFVLATHSCRLLPGLTPTAMLWHGICSRWGNGNLLGTRVAFIASQCCSLCSSVWMVTGELLR